MPFRKQTAAGVALRKRVPREPLGESALFTYAVGALARRMRTVAELKRLLRSRAVEGEEGERDVDRVVERLRELNYLSDQQFAAVFTRLRKEGSAFGKRRVQQDLAQRGVNKEVADAALEEAYGGEDELELARAYCERKRLAPPAGADAKKEAARLMNRLLRAGYSAGTIFKLLRSWKVDVEES